MDLASYIEHSFLKPDCRLEDIEQLCREAALHGVAAVCVPPFYVPHAANLLEGHKVKVVTVAGFPLGYTATPAKVEEIKRAIDDGADEVEAVVNFCAVKNNNWNFVANDIDSMTTAAHLKGKTIKAILEPGLLTDKETSRLCEIAIEAQVDFIKLYSGFNGQEATLEALQAFRNLSGNKIKITTFGGIHHKQDVERFIEAGARRVGTATEIAAFI